MRLCALWAPYKLCLERRSDPKSAGLFFTPCSPASAMGFLAAAGHLLSFAGPVAASVSLLDACHDCHLPGFLWGGGS